MTLSIRKSVAEDRDLFKKVLNQQGVLKYFPMYDQREIDETIRIWLELFVPKGATLTAELDGVPVGIAFLNLQAYKKFAHQCLITIVVDESCRGQGIGSRLMEDLAILAKEEFSLEMLHLEVYEGNPARRLYERLGYTVYGISKDYIKDSPTQYIDKVLMEKIL